MLKKISLVIMVLLSYNITTIAMEQNSNKGSNEQIFKDDSDEDNNLSEQVDDLLIQEIKAKKEGDSGEDVNQLLKLAAKISKKCLYPDSEDIIYIDTTDTAVDILDYYPIIFKKSEKLSQFAYLFPKGMLIEGNFLTEGKNYSLNLFQVILSYYFPVALTSDRGIEEKEQTIDKLMVPLDLLMRIAVDNDEQLEGKEHDAKECLYYLFLRFNEVIKFQQNYIHHDGSILQNLAQFFCNFFSTKDSFNTLITEFNEPHNKVFQSLQQDFNINENQQTMWLETVASAIKNNDRVKSCLNLRFFKHAKVTLSCDEVDLNLQKSLILHAQKMPAREFFKIFINPKKHIEKFIKSL